MHAASARPAGERRRRILEAVDSRIPSRGTGARRRLRLPAVRAKREIGVGAVALAGIASFLYGLADVSVDAAAMVGGLLAVVLALAYFRGAA